MLYCILGDSGSGKDSIVDYLVKLNTCERLVTNTTRPKRVGETNGKQYIFTTYDDMMKSIDAGEVAEVRRYEVASSDKGWFYYTTKSTLNQVIDGNYVTACSPSQFSSYHKALPEHVYPIILLVSDADRFIRLINRDENQDIQELYRRFKNDKDSIAKYINEVDTCHMINNKYFDETALRICVLIKSNKLRQDDRLFSFDGLNLSLSSIRNGLTFKSLTNIENPEVQLL